MQMFVITNKDGDKCRCECKELIDIVLCDIGFFWTLRNCQCECDESCHVGENLDLKFASLEKG